MSKPNEDEDDYGAELDAMVQETEQQIKKKTETGGKKSMFQAAVQGGIDAQNKQQQQQPGQPSLNSEDEEFKKLQEQMEGMDLDKMMQSLFSGALGGGPPQDGAPNQQDMPDFSQITEMLGKMGQDMAKEQQNNPSQPNQNPEQQNQENEDVDPKHVEEAQKLFKECLDSIERETSEYQKNQKMEEEENKDEEQIKPKVVPKVDVKEDKKTDEPVIQDDDPNAMFKNFQNVANQHESQAQQQKSATSSGTPQADPFAALLQGMATGDGKDEENPFNNPEMMNMFNQMLGGAPGSQNKEGGPNDQNMNDIFKQFTTFLSESGQEDDTFKGALDSVVTEIISKDSLYKPMKHLKEEYPQWLEENWESVSGEDLERYNNQLDKVTEICELFESEAINKEMNNKEKVFELLGQLQELGHPPDSLMKHIQDKYGEEAHPAPHQQEPLNLAEGMPPGMAELFASLNKAPAPGDTQQPPAASQSQQSTTNTTATPPTNTNAEEQPKFNNPFEGL